MTEFFAALSGGLIGGLFGMAAAILVVRRTEYYRIAGHLRLALRDCLRRLADASGHPVSVVENDAIDNLVADIMPVFTVLRRHAFNQAWREYRYDKQHGELSFPTEYTTKGTVEAKRMIESRIHAVLSCLQ